MNRRHGGCCSRSALCLATIGVMQIVIVEEAHAQAAAPPGTAIPQTPPPAPPADAPSAQPPSFPPPPPATGAATAAPMSASPAAPPPVVQLPPPPAKEPDASASIGEKVAHMDQPPPPKPTIAYNFGVRVGVKLQDPVNPKSMSELHLDGGSNGAYVEARFHGDLNDYFGWVANFNAAATGYGFGSSGDVGTMDLLVKARACEALQLWAGRLLVPSDRSNFAGPFFMSPWNYPGAFGPAFVGPKTGPNGRDQGATLWGMAGPDDKFKYYVGAYGIDNSGASPTTQAYYSGRISYSLQGSEPGYFGSSTYYGDKSVVTVGVAGQYQKNGSVDLNGPGGTPSGTKDTTTFMADILAEEAVAGTGTFSLEGTFYAFNTGQVVGGSGSSTIYTPKEEFYVLAAYLTPEAIGIGKLQPLVRVQQTIDPGWTVVDAQLAYVMQSYFLKAIVNYQHLDMGSSSANALQFGLQAQM